MPLVHGLPRIAAVAALGLTLIASLAPAPVAAQSPSPSPTAAASPSPAPAASPTPVTGPTASPAPAASPAVRPAASPVLGPFAALVLEDLLLAREPAGLTNCQSVREPVFAGELAAVACPLGVKGEGMLVRLLDSPATLDSVFAGYLGVKAGKRGTCAKRIAVEPRVDAGKKVGQLACYDATDGTRVFIWTDERFSIISWIVAAKDRPFKQLYKLYTSVGPYEIAPSTASPAP